MAGVDDEQGDLGSRLRRRRAELGLTQEDVAERTGLSVRAIRDIELGLTGRPRRSSVALLARELGLGRPLPEAAPTPAPGPVAGPVPGLVVPRQLPARTPDFAGRTAELGALSQLLDDAGPDPETPVVAAISGTAGVGKTTLAVQWAHQVAGRFPDGQLYIDLRGFGPGRPVAPEDALCGFLEALAVPAARIPVRPEARAGLYRSLLASRRMLVLLDNAGDADQVRALIPGGGGCLALVTSRGPLTGLAVAQGARLVALDVLSAADALDLLARRLGPGRLAAEPQAADALVRLTAGLPLALSITTARAAAHPGCPLDALAAELRDASNGPSSRGPENTGALTTGPSTAEPSADVGVAFWWSYRRLSEPAARMFRLLGLHPGPEVTAAAAAGLAGSTPDTARRALTELADGGLDTERGPGRFGCHDLLRGYAAEQGLQADPQAARTAARGRMLDHYLHTAHAGMLLIEPANPLTLEPPAPGARPEAFADRAAAMAWFRAEHEVLLALVAEAARTGFDRHAWQLPCDMMAYLNHNGRWHDWAATHRIAVAAAARLDDPQARARAHRGLGLALTRLRQEREAAEHLRRALRLFRRLSDRTGQATSHVSLSELLDSQYEHRASLGHARRALRLCEAMGHQLGQAAALILMGQQHARLGELQPGIECCRRALGLCREIGNHGIAGDAWEIIGGAHMHLGGTSEAVACYRRALEEYRQALHRPGEADGYDRLGDAQYSTGDLDAAADSWRRALAIYTELNDADAAAVRAKLRQEAVYRSPARAVRETGPSQGLTGSRGG